MKERTRDLVWAALFLAIGVIVPYIFHTTGMPGQILLPMHIPVLLCGFVLGKRYGLIVGIVTPFINSVIIGMPVLYPTGVCMIFELGCYGFLTGFLYEDRKKNIFTSLIAAMIAGRIISGIANYILLTVGGSTFVLGSFLAASFVKGLLGIIIQIIFIPVIVKYLNKVRGGIVINE